jgi:hypothetical protein
MRLTAGVYPSSNCRWIQKQTLIAVKTASHPSFARIIRREARILKELKHQLIVELRDDTV